MQLFLLMLHNYCGDHLLMMNCSRWGPEVLMLAGNSLVCYWHTVWIKAPVVWHFHCTWTTKLPCKETTKTRKLSLTSLWTDHLLFLTIIRLLIVEIDFPKYQTVPGELPVFFNCSSFCWLTAAVLLWAVRGAGNEGKRTQQKYEICSKNMLRDVWCFITGSAYWTICKTQHVRRLFLSDESVFMFLVLFKSPFQNIFVKRALNKVRDSANLVVLHNYPFGAEGGHTQNEWEGLWQLHIDPFTNLCFYNSITRGSFNRFPWSWNA